METTHTYHWVDGARKHGDAQAVGERLEALRRQHGGQLEPKTVVADAAGDDSPLRPFFEWRDDIAAEQYRLEQARRLIRSVAVIVERPSAPVRAFVAVRHQGERDASYTSTVDALRDADLRRQVIGTARRELEGWRNRYRAHQELATIIDRLDGVFPQLELLERTAGDGEPPRAAA